nr:LUD domain-containing protein [Limosilactobacillus fermentum]
MAIGLADYLIAATGSVTVVNRPEMGRGFNFLPTHYVALVPQSGLVRSTRQAMVNYEHRFAEGLKTSAITIISGPSNSKWNSWLGSTARFSAPTWLFLTGNNVVTQSKRARS